MVLNKVFLTKLKQVSLSNFFLGVVSVKSSLDDFHVWSGVEPLPEAWFWSVVLCIEDKRGFQGYELDTWVWSPRNYIFTSFYGDTETLKWFSLRTIVLTWRP
jgi:hypothetical protein